MTTLRPPSASPSPSPAPSPGSNGAANSRASLGRPANLSPTSPRPGAAPGSARPASELVGNAPKFQTPESDAIDQWFENLQTYENTLEEMAAASLDANFKEELGSIEQWFSVLSEAERTAALYSLLQSSTQVQIRFFITVLQQMARSDPVTALLSPSAGGSMQAQMDAKLASMSLKSPGFKPSAPLSPVARSFAPSNPPLLSADAASSGDAAATLAQQRAKLKAANASHRISAPGTLSYSTNERNIWSPPQLGQVDEADPSLIQPTTAATDPTAPSPAQATTTVRPKSTDFTGVANSFHGQAEGQELTTPAASGNWASQVNTPLIPMFNEGSNEQQPTLDGAASKLQNLSNGKAASATAKTDNVLADGTDHVVLDDASTFRRVSGSKSAYGASERPVNMNIYGDDGNLMLPGVVQPGQPRGTQSANWRTPKTASSEQMTFGMGVPNPNPNMIAPDMQALLNGMGGFNMLNMAAMGVNPLQAQFLAAQMAAGQFSHPAMGFSTPPMRTGGRSASGRAGSTRMTMSMSGRESTVKEEDIDPAVLDDVPTWLRSLRLHKYTTNFEGMTWREIVKLDDASLEAKGVVALGARRKMLKTFDAVREKMAGDL